MRRWDWLMPLLVGMSLGCGREAAPAGPPLAPGREALVYAAAPAATVQLWSGPGKPGRAVAVGTRVRIVEQSALPDGEGGTAPILRVSVLDGPAAGTVGYVTPADLRPMVTP
jgi:hypothetical protein